MDHDEATPLTTGTVFHDRYEVVRALASGGMGAVYEVVDRRTKRHKALKVMLASVVASPELRSRFKLEATVAAEIESEHIVETTDAGVDDATGAPFLVMELLKGEELAAVLARRGRLPAEEIVQLLGQVALALDRTHAAGIVHRDLKPENLFVTRRDDGSPRVKILDFGIAKVVAQGARTGAQTQAIGTPVYMSPEQLAGEGTLGPRSDLYAVAHIAFTLLTGRAYWADELAAHGSLYPVLVKIMQGATEPASARAGRRGVALPAAFDAWFARGTAVDAAARFASASELVGALAAALEVASATVPLATSATAVAPAIADDASRSGPQPSGRTTAAVASELPAGVPARRAPPTIAIAIGAVALVAIAVALRAPGAGGGPAPASGAPASAPTTATTTAATPTGVTVTPTDAPAASSAPATSSAPPPASASAAPKRPAAPPKPTTPAPSFD